MTEKEFKRPPLRQRRRHRFRQMFNGWPWLVWCGAAVAALLLVPGGMYRVRFHGVAERTYEYVSPIEDGRLISLTVDLGDVVSEGQLIGEIDNQSLASDLLMNEASLMKSRDKVQSIRYDLERMKLEQAQLQGELKTMEAQWTRTQNLLARKLVLEQDIEDLQPRIDSAKEVLAQYPNVIGSLKERLNILEQESATFDSEELRKLQAAQRRLETQSAGMVAEVLHNPGDVVETGDPVVRISNMSTSRVIAFMPEEKRMDIPEGERCRVITSISREVFDGVIIGVTADIRKLPVFTGFGDQILRGRRIVIELEGDAELVPGEQVVVVPDVSVWNQWLGKK